MTSLAVGAAVAGVLTIVRDDILSIGVSNGLTLLSGLSASSPELKAQLEEMDIEAMLRTVEAVVNEVETDFNKHKKHAAAGAGAGASAAGANGSNSVDSLDSTASTASTASAAAAAAVAAVATAAGGKDVDGGWVAVNDAAAADAKSAAAAATAAAIASDAKSSAAGAAGVVSATVMGGPKFTARKKSSLLHCTGNAAVALAIDQLEDAVWKVHAVLQELEREATAQNAKWFSAWRGNAFGPLTERLRALQAVLDKRLDLLLKVLSLKSLTTQHVAYHAQAHAIAQPVTGSLAPPPAAAAAATTAPAKGGAAVGAAAKGKGK